MSQVHLDVLKNVRVASPCHVAWEDMAGTAQVRHCDQCNLNVYNFSEMTAEDAAALVQSAEGRLCARFWRRPDGTMLTRDCPVGLAALRAKVAKALMRVAAAVGLIATGSALLGARPRDDRRLAWVEPFATLREWMAPNRAMPIGPGQVMMGMMGPLPPTTPTPPVTNPANTPPADQTPIVSTCTPQ